MHKVYFLQGLSFFVVSVLVIVIVILSVHVAEPCMVLA